MFLVRLIYASTACGNLNATDFQNILTASIRNNRQGNITGMLSCDGRYFLQCLEGSRKAVNETYTRILNDPRHSDVVLLSYGEIPSRHFGEWAMGYVALTSNAEIQRDVLLRLVLNPDDAPSDKPRVQSLPIPRTKFLKYSTKSEFEPYSLSEDGSLALLRDLATLFA
jgi:hypothetical protein